MPKAKIKANTEKKFTSYQDAVCAALGRRPIRQPAEIAADVAIHFAQVERSEIWSRIADDAGKVARAIWHIDNNVEPAAARKVVAAVGHKYRATIVENEKLIGYSFRSVPVLLDRERYPDRVLWLGYKAPEKTQNPRI